MSIYEREKHTSALSSADLLIPNDRGMMDPPGDAPGPPIMTDVLVDGVPAKAGIGFLELGVNVLCSFLRMTIRSMETEWGTKLTTCSIRKILVK